MLLSRHRDAEILSHAAYHLGFDFVRGSTNRGGVAAIRELLAKSRTHAPDDHARRPARPAAAVGPGLRLPGLETGAAAGGDGLRLRSSVAGATAPGTSLPFRGPTRAPGRCPAARFSCRPTWTARASNTSARRSSGCLNRLTAEAEAWAESGTRKIGQRKLERRGAARCEKTYLHAVSGKQVRRLLILITVQRTA